jgi:hypothetical protein
MKVERSTRLRAEPERVWQQVNRPAALQYVARPLLSFEPVDPPAFPDTWQPREYRVRLKLFGLIPMGWQIMGVEFPDDDRAVDEARFPRHLRDNGRGLLIRRWDHRISIDADASGGARMTRYTDRVDIDAGVLTAPVALFARVFYAHRQRRWRRLLSTRNDGS